MENMNKPNTHKLVGSTSGHITHKQILNDSKLACDIVSSAIAGVIRRSMADVDSFHQQCYNLLQVDNTKEAERELNKRLLNIVAGQVTTNHYSHNPLHVNKDELQLDKFLDETQKQYSLKDDWLEQARADAEEWS